VHQSIPLMKVLSSEGKQDERNKVVELYAQGLVDHYDELLKVCCVGDTSMDRLVPGFEAPTKENNSIGWHDRTKTVRIPGSGERLEYRLPDPEMNSYLAISLMLRFGYEAVKKGI
jgi:glutamine synthetase